MQTKLKTKTIFTETESMAYFMKVMAYRSTDMDVLISLHNYAGLFMDDYPDSKVWDIMVIVRAMTDKRIKEFEAYYNQG